MSETNVQNVDQNQLADLFPDLGIANTGSNPRFGMSEDQPNLFPTLSEDTPKGEEKKTPEDTDTEKKDEKVDEKVNTGEEGQDTDLFKDGEDNKPTGSQIADLTTYYEDRIKSGKFVPIETEDDKGNPVPFIPKTAEEYDEVLELQINYRLEQEKKALQEKWYQSKSPAWKVVSQYAELVDDPSQLIPFLQGVKTMTSVANLDETTLEGAEQIVRTRLLQRGDTEEIIDQQIDALKTTDKLVNTAKMYKPVILQQEQAALQQMKQREQQQEMQYRQIVSEIRESALQSIEAPLFGKTKLKNEEKAVIYDMIAEPSDETQGYGIYSVIDQLFDKKDFEKLKEVALLLSNREAFMNYLGTNIANATVAGLEKKLRVAAESRSSSGNNFHEEQRQPRVSRNQFKKPSFGRG